jgi:Mrp family chromosome partitioning ATPase
LNPAQGRALALGRLSRALQRQALPVLAVALTIGAVGVAAELLTGSQWRTAAVFWAPVGIGAGLIVGLVGELGRNTVTRLSSFGKHRGYAVVGAAPELSPSVLRQLPPDRRTPIGCLAFWPSSGFATAFRDLQGSLPDRGVIAFIGSLPGDGATTTALCAATSAAQQGKSVIVIDCDLRFRGLTRALDVEPSGGTLEACETPESWQRFVGEETETGLHFLPAARAQNPWRTMGPTLRPLLEKLRPHYDLVVLDCPPAIESAEGALIARMADRTVVVTAWDRTPLGAVRRTMRHLHTATRAATTAIYVNRVPSGFRFGRVRGE